MQDIKNEEYIICPRCGREVYKEAVTCPFCNFGIMVWLEGVAWTGTESWIHTILLLQLRIYLFIQNRYFYFMFHIFPPFFFFLILFS